VVGSILSYGCEIWTVDCRLKKKLLSTEIDFFQLIGEHGSNTNNFGKNEK
jgi:hypothetical protein